MKKQNKKNTLYKNNFYIINFNYINDNPCSTSLGYFIKNIDLKNHIMEYTSNLKLAKRFLIEELNLINPFHVVYDLINHNVFDNKNIIFNIYLSHDFPAENKKGYVRITGDGYRCKPILNSNKKYDLDIFKITNTDLHQEKKEN